MTNFHDRPWGPSHQHLPPLSRGPLWFAPLKYALAALVLLNWLQRPGVLHLLLLAAVLVGAWAYAERSRHRDTQPGEQAQMGERGEGGRARSQGPPHAGARMRELASASGGGAFLGVCQRRWAFADAQHAVLVLGPPRSGKTSAIVIPTLLCASGPAVCTSTKTDVLQATRRARGELGEVWLFDPAGAQADGPQGVRRLCWSPIAASGSWDGALLTARAMALASTAGRGTANEGHWRERAAALLAPLLHAAALTERPIGETLRWVLQQDLDPAGKALEAGDVRVANDVLAGIARTDARERSSIFSATAGVLSAYNAHAARETAATCNFDPARFACSTDTIYITAPAHQQALVAPLIVGLLEQIRYATYARQEAPPAAPVVWCLDEVANIAPIHDLPALVSEAGGQGLHVLACLQDLSQARARWGEAADGFLSLFQTKLVLAGVADTRTLEAVSVMTGEYDRHVVSHTATRSRAQTLKAPPTDGDSIAYSTQRQRVLSAGEIHRLPPGQALLLDGARWGLTRLTPAHRCEPWTELIG